MVSLDEGKVTLKSRNNIDLTAKFPELLNMEKSFRATCGLFDGEIVALDEDEATLEIQHYDGAVEEIDFDSWEEMEAFSIEPPEDWSGSLDIEREDYGVDLELTSPAEHNNPLDELD
jgi:hypothetical protein